MKCCGLCGAKWSELCCEANSFKRCEPRIEDGFGITEIRRSSKDSEEGFESKAITTESTAYSQFSMSFSFIKANAGSEGVSLDLFERSWMGTFRKILRNNIYNKRCKCKCDEYINFYSSNCFKYLFCLMLDISCFSKFGIKIKVH